MYLWKAKWVEEKKKSLKSKRPQITNSKMLKSYLIKLYITKSKVCKIRLKKANYKTSKRNKQCQKIKKQKSGKTKYRLIKPLLNQEKKTIIK